MKKHAPSPISLLLILGFSVLILASRALVYAQSNTSPAATPGKVSGSNTNTNSANTNSSESQQHQLVEAQRKYYEVQTAKLNDERSTWQRIVNLSAFLAALVAVMSLILNYSSTLRAQRDTQFYEALKRFGDPDSPTVRSSAAGLLAKLSNQKGIIFWWHRPNFNIVLEQLMASLLLEENSVCLNSILDSLRHLITYDPIAVLHKVGPSNRRIQKEMVRALARFFALNGTDETTALVFGEHWHDAAALTPYEGFVLYTLAVRHADNFERECQRFTEEHKTIDPTKNGEYFAEAQRAVEVASNRLKLSVILFSELLRTDAFRELVLRLDKQVDSPQRPTASTINFDGVFLARADLSETMLRRASFGNAQLQSTNLHGSDLVKAVLSEAQLQGARLDLANMQGANLSFAQLQPLKLKKLVGPFAETSRTVVRELALPDLPLQQSTSLYKANLQGSDLSISNLQEVLAQEVNLNGAKLKWAKLFSMKVDASSSYAPADFENSNWWEADFSNAPQGEYFHLGEKIDKKLLEDLFERYGNKVPKDSWHTHSSVQRFLQEKQEQPASET